MNTDVAFTVRAVERHDFPAWKPRWAGCNAFYGRHGPRTGGSRVPS